jgi:hypothetical protein
LDWLQGDSSGWFGGTAHIWCIEQQPAEQFAKSYWFQMALYEGWPMECEKCKMPIVSHKNLRKVYGSCYHPWCLFRETTDIEKDWERYFKRVLEDVPWTPLDYLNERASWLPFRLRLWRKKRFYRDERHVLASEKILDTVERVGK